MITNLSVPAESRIVPSVVLAPKPEDCPPMYWNLRSKTREPEFVWKLAFGILVVGMLVAWTVQAPPEDWPSDEITEVVPEDLVPDDPRYEEYNKYIDHLEHLAATSQWGQLWWGIPKGLWLGLTPGPTALALVTGVCWLVFTLQAGQPHREAGIRWWLALIAVPLGVLSVWPTLFAVYWQEQVMNIYEATDLQGGLKLYIAGVGLREELSKLLLFLPLVPFVIRRRSEREALLVAACVGLGFAMEENINYIHNYGNAPERFLTANFLHMALTGLAGLALCRGIWNPRERAAEAGVVFLAAVFAHGLYDALQVLPDLEMINLAAMIMYVLLAYQFFHELREWWQPPGETISLTATFLVTVALVVSATMIYLSTQWGLRAAALRSVGELISTAMFVYMFLREMPESIIDV